MATTSVTRAGRLLFEDHGEHREDSNDGPTRTISDRCHGFADYFEASSFEKAVGELVQFHQRGGNLKSVQEFLDGSIDYTLDNLDLKFIPNDQQPDQQVVVGKATEYLQQYYEQHPSPRQGYGEPLPGVWSNKKHKALFDGRTIDVMERRVAREKWDAGLGPIGPLCKNEIRLGDQKGDGYKFMCVPQQARTNSSSSLEQQPIIQQEQRQETSQKSCHVISVGGNDNWKFEQSVVNTLGCETYTFDCTLPGGMPQRKPKDDRIHFYNYCIDGHDHDDVHGRKFVTYDKLLIIAGIQEAPEYFKIDVEGYEYDIFTQMVNNDHALLPQQIQVELHWGTRMTGLPWMLRMRSSAEITLLMAMLFNVAGYMPVKLDYNPYCKSCMEVLFFRGGTMCAKAIAAAAAF
jgi:Methyltransferase domain